MTARGVPEYIQSDNGPEFTARAVRAWLGGVGAGTLYIRARVTVGKRLRGKLQWEAEGRTAKSGGSYTLLEVQVLTEQYRRTYNRI